MSLGLNLDRKGQTGGLSNVMICQKEDKLFVDNFNTMMTSFLEMQNACELAQPEIQTQIEAKPNSQTLPVLLSDVQTKLKLCDEGMKSYIGFPTGPASPGETTVNNPFKCSRSEVVAEMIPNSCPANPNMSTTSLHFCQNYQAVDMLEHTYHVRQKTVGLGCKYACSQGNLAVSQAKEKKKSFEEIFGHLISTSVAKAKIGEGKQDKTLTNILGMVGLTLGAALGVINFEWNLVTSWYQTPQQRFWWNIGILTVIEGSSIALNAVAINQLEQDIDRLENLKDARDAALESDEGSVSEAGEDDKNDDGEDDSSEGDGEYADTGGMTNTGRRSGGTSSGSSFSAAASASECISIECRFKMIPGNHAKFINQQVNSSDEDTKAMGKFLKEITSNPTPAGMSRSEVQNAAVNFNKRRGSLKNKLRQVQERINKARKDNGKKPVDFARMAQKMVKRITDPIVNPKDPKIATALAEGRKVAALGPGFQDFKAPKSKIPQFDYSIGELSTSDSAITLEDETSELVIDQTGAEEAIEELEIEMDSINNKKGVNIFKMISRRYFRSAYPVFFEKK